MVLTPATAVQQEAMGDLIVRAQLVKDRQVQPEEDNMLKVTSDGRAIALDPRLRDMEGPEPEETTRSTWWPTTCFASGKKPETRNTLTSGATPPVRPVDFQIVDMDLGALRER